MTETKTARQEVLSSDVKPVHNFNVEGIPETLTTPDRWVCWAWEKKAGKWTKPLKQANHPLRNASSTDANTWTDFSTAVASAEQNGLGIGFVFDGSDDLIGIDLDDCRDPATGKLAGWALDFIDILKTYTEVSPSGTGVKIFVRGVLPEGCRSGFKRPEGDGKVEVYSKGRFFTVTGQRVHGTPDDVRERQGPLTALMTTLAKWVPEVVKPVKVQAQPQQPLTPDRERQIKRASTYLAPIPGAVSGQDGSRDTFIVVKKVLGFRLNREDTFDVLQPWNLKCVPPWSDAELWHKIDGAMKSEVVPMADREQLPAGDVPRFDPLDDSEQATGEAILGTVQTVEDSSTFSAEAVKPAQTDPRQEQVLRQVLQQGLKRLSEGRDLNDVLSFVSSNVNTIVLGSEVETFETMTSEQLDAVELHTEYLVDDILAAGQPCIIAASKKSLKTTIAIDLTLSLASGAKFLNKYYVPRPVRVAMMSGESGDAVIQETCRRIARSKPWINFGDYSNALWSFALPRLGQPRTKASLSKFVKDNRLEVLIVDPAYLCLDLGDDAGNLFSVGKKLFELTEVGRETGCTIIIVHHNRKAPKENQFNPPELESIAWSGFQEWARQWILLGRREAYNPENAGSHRLWLSVGGSAGHSVLCGVNIEEGSRKDQGGRRWEVSVDGASAVVAENIQQGEAAKEQRAQAKAAKKLEADTAKLLKAYQKYPEGETERFYGTKARLNGTDCGAANEKLLEDGKVEACEITKKNKQTYPGFRLVTAVTTTTATDCDNTVTALRQNQSVTVEATHCDNHPKGVVAVSHCAGSVDVAGVASETAVNFDSVDSMFGGSKA